jgi:uncharacterized protein CbrC (UPF0167 family)
MQDSQLPLFTYHPDPIKSGSVLRSDKRCLACKEVRGWIYVGPVYSQIDLDEALCPWCIADGSAHNMFHAEFFDPGAIGDYGRLDTVPENVVEEIAFRTPSFNGWQQERWMTHCRDASLFIAPMGAKELLETDPAIHTAVAEETGLQGEELRAYMNAISSDRGPTAYVFRCRHCGAWSGYSDCP